MQGGPEVEKSQFAIQFLGTCVIIAMKLAYMMSMDKNLVTFWTSWIYKNIISKGMDVKVLVKITDRGF